MAVSKVILDGTTLIDLTDDTVVASALLNGIVATGADGVEVTGTIQTVSAGVPTATKGTVSNHSVSVTPSVTNTSGYISGGTETGTAVTVSASELVSGTLPITENDTYDVTNYESVSVVVPAPTISLQDKSAAPTESQQVVEADSQYDGLNSVTVGAISSTYVGSNITRRSSTDLTASGATVTVPSGYYESQGTKSVATTTHPDPTVSVNSTGLITASHTQTEGYVSAGTTTGTSQLTTQAATTITPSSQSQTAVASGVYTTGAVTVSAIPLPYVDVSSTTATAEDVIEGKAFFNANGTLTIGTAEGATEMTVLSYGHSTWQDFIDAYSTNTIVYCRASSNSNPATGAQGRMAFMAYVNNGENPTNVEFQYYRSVNQHSDSQQGDQVYVYKLDKTAGWTVTVRENYTKIVAGAGLGSYYSSGILTLTGTIPKSTVTLTAANWTGSGPYTQTVTISGGTSNSKIDIQLTPAQLTQLVSDGVFGLMIENNSGTFTAYALGAAPTTNMTVQITRTETS